MPVEENGNTQTQDTQPVNGSTQQPRFGLEDLMQPQHDDGQQVTDDGSLGDHGQQQSQVSDEHWEGLVEAALDNGIDPEPYREHPDLLERTILGLERRFAEIGRQTFDDTRERPHRQPEAPKPIEEFQLALNEEVLDAETVKQIKAMHEWHRQQREADRDEINSLRDYLERQEQQRDQAAFENFISGLGPEYQTLLGKGPTHNLNPKGEHYRARYRIAEEAAALAAGYERYGRAIPPKEVLLARALKIVEDDKAVSRRKTPLSSGRPVQTRDQNTGRFTPTARPSHRQPGPLPEGEERAIQAVSQRMAEHRNRQ